MTTPAERKALIAELRVLIGPYPGRNDTALSRARALLGELEWRSNAYTREKAGTVLEDFQLWFSKRRWMRYCGGVPEHFRIRLLSSIQKLEGSFRD